MRTRVARHRYPISRADRPVRSFHRTAETHTATSARRSLPLSRRHRGTGAESAVITGAHRERSLLSRGGVCCHHWAQGRSLLSLPGHGGGFCCHGDRVCDHHWAQKRSMISLPGHGGGVCCNRIKTNDGLVFYHHRSTGAVSAIYAYHYLFLYLAITALHSNQLFERITLLVTEQVKSILLLFVHFQDWSGSVQQ